MPRKAKSAKADSHSEAVEAAIEKTQHANFGAAGDIPAGGINEKIRQLIRQSKEQGYLTFDDINEALPESVERMRQPDLDPGDAPEGTEQHELPEDDAWVEARSLVETVRDDELIDPQMTAERLLFRLFHERGVRIFSPQPLVDRCRCTRQRIAAMLDSFTEEERQDMTVDGEIVVTCQFCNSHYHFAADAG